MTIALGSKGKGRDLEMGWWQYLPLGERSQRCVDAVMGGPLCVPERDADQLRGRDCQQYLQHILRNRALLDDSFPLSSPSNFPCQKLLPRPSILTILQR